MDLGLQIRDWARRFSLYFPKPEKQEAKARCWVVVPYTTTTTTTPLHLLQVMNSTIRMDYFFTRDVPIVLHLSVSNYVYIQ
jgi:hypothetical protein